MSDVQGVLEGFERYQPRQRSAMSGLSVKLLKSRIELGEGVMTALGLGEESRRVFLDWNPKRRILRISSADGERHQSVAVSSNRTIDARKFFFQAKITKEDRGEREATLRADGSVLVTLALKEELPF